jgi:hypothetical protein
MKKNLLLFTLLLPLSLMAQRTDLDKAWFNYTYRHLPSRLLDNSFMTYSVKVEKTVALDMYSNESANSLINIEGRKKVDGKGHFNVVVNLSDLIIESTEVKERVEIHKDKDGKETGRSYYYKVDVTYSFAADAKVTDFKGSQIAVYSLANRSTKRVFSTSEYSSSSDAVNFYNNNKLEIKTQLVKQNIEESLSSLDLSLNNDFGYKTITSREYLWALGSKKSPEFAAYGQAIETLKGALESISNEAIPANINERMQPAIDYFIGLAAKYTDPEEKDQKKLRYGAYYNIALSYYFTEQFEKAVEYANLLVTNDYDKKDGENMVKDIRKVQEELEQHSLTTRHFHPDTENAVPPQL